MSFTLAASAVSGQARSTQAPIAPQPFTNMPVRAQPVPSTRAEMPAARALTTAEQTLLRKLFGDDAPVGDIRLLFDRAGNSAATNDNGTADDGAVHVQDPRMFSKDYSLEADPYLFGYFVNRMTAEMQRLKGDAWAADATASGSFYTVGGDARSFDSYGREQQRAIMEDYALRFLHRTRQSYWLSRMYDGDRSITDPYLIAAVEGKFSSAKKARIENQHIILRHLTAGETQLIRGIFGDTLDTSGIWVHLSPLSYKDVAGATASAQEVYFYGRNRSNDYSQEDANALSVFLHEMTHIWQFQTDRRYTVVVNDHYEYTVNDAARFEDYNIEQQAAMIEDFVLYHLNPDHKMRWLPKGCTAEDLPARTQQMLHMVETFFPAARDFGAPAPAAPLPLHKAADMTPTETLPETPAETKEDTPQAGGATAGDVAPARASIAPKPPAA